MRDVLLYNDDLWEPVYTFEYTGEPAEFTLDPGKYLMVCHGARGGGAADGANTPSYGGSSYGILNLSEETTMFAVVGGKGTDAAIGKESRPGGYNGGGAGGGSYSTSVTSGAGGGGASDIRLNIDPDVTSYEEKNIPDEYNVLNGIPSQLDTALYLNYAPNKHTTTVMDVYIGADTHSTDVALFGCIEDGNYIGYAIYLRRGSTDGYYPYLPGCDGYVKEASWPRNDRFILSLNENTMELYQPSTDETFVSQYQFAPVSDPYFTNCALFGVYAYTNNSYALWNGCAKNAVVLYSLIFRENGTDVRYFIPVINTTTSATGLYDLCTDEFLPYNFPKLNSFPVATNKEETVDGITFTTADGQYSISGNATNTATCRFDLTESITIPNTLSYGGNACLIFGNANSFPSTVTVDFCYDDGESNTVQASFTNFSAHYVWYDSPSEIIRYKTFNNIVITVNSGASVNLGLGIMLTTDGTQNGSATYEKPGYDTLDTRTFQLQKVSQPSLNSRIIVAGGAGGNIINYTDDSYGYSFNTCHGGGIIGGVANNVAVHNTNTIHRNDFYYASQTDGAWFGRGMNCPNKAGTSSSTNTGTSGGGGGWFGGYTVPLASNWYNAWGSGGGGSGYILTEASYKPEGYMDGYDIEKYYMTDPMMSIGTADNAKVIIYKKTRIRTNDTVKCICTGKPEKITLPVGEFRLSCNGGWGGCRNNVSYAARGGRAVGTISLSQPVDIYSVVGGSPTFRCTSAENNVFPAYIISASYPYSSYNGGYAPLPQNIASQGSSSGGGTDFRLSIPHKEPKTFYVPEGFKELEYIQNIGYGQIRTGVIFTPSMDVIFDGVVYNSGLNAYEFLFGTRNGNSSGDQRMSYGLITRTSGSYRFYYEIGGITSSASYDGVYNERIIIQTRGRQLLVYQDGELKYSGSSGDNRTVTVEDVMIFAINQGNYVISDPTPARVYSFKITDNGIITNYFVPCRTNNAVFDIPVTWSQDGTNIVSQYLNWSFINKPRSIKINATDTDGNSLMWKIISYYGDNNGTTETQSDWLNSGTLFSLGRYHTTIRIWLKHSDDSSLTSEMIDTFEISTSDWELGLYDIITQTFHPVIWGDVTSESQQLVGGDIVETPTRYDTIIDYDINHSLNTRFIVAGGAGGIGLPSKTHGGVGGGTTGGSVGSVDGNSSGYGTNYGPGTQTNAGAGAIQLISGGFGYGGSSMTHYNGGIGGCGGGGWFGGSATSSDSSADDERGGAGGSGYILTEASYKPEGYMDGYDIEKYYMTDPVLTDGGTTDRLGISSASIYAYVTNWFKLIIEDSEGYKRYDHTSGRWVIEPNIEYPTTENINEYGVYSIETEDGIVGEYNVFIFDEEDLISMVIFHVVPPTLTIETNVQTQMMVEKIIPDFDNLDSNLNCEITVHNLINSKNSLLTIKLDMLDDPISVYKLYSLSLTSTMSKDYSPPVEKEKVYLDHVDLLTVGTANRIPMVYNSYMPPTLNDGTDTVITSIWYSSAIEYERCIYSLVVVNKTRLRLMKYVLATKEQILLFEIPLSDLNIDSDHVMVGSFLVDERYVYITQKFNVANIIRISLTDPTDITTISWSGTSGSIAFGKMKWISNEEFILCILTGVVIFNTRLQEITLNKSGFNSSSYAGDMDANDKYCICCGWNGNSNSTLRVFNMKTQTFTSLTMDVGYRGVIAHDEKYFFIMQRLGSGSNQITVVDGDTLTIRNRFSIPITTTNGLTMSYSDNVLYITLEKISTIYICELTEDRMTYKSFTSVGVNIPFGEPGPNTIYSVENHFFPTVFKQYFFVPYYQLFTMNYLSDSKYNLGYKYNKMIVQTNKTFESNFEISDDRFITFNDSHISVHTGYIEIPVEEYSEHIFTIHNDRKYRKLINTDFN